MKRKGNRPYSRSFGLSKSNLYRNFILKLRRPKKRSRYRVFFGFFSKHERCDRWSSACQGTKKWSRGRHVLGVVIFFARRLKNMILIKKMSMQPHYPNTQNNKTSTCIIITTAAPPCAFLAYAFFT